MKIIALIPARSGSKGIIDKNIKLYKGKPLLWHSINIAKQSKYISKIYLSSDSEEYNKIGIEMGIKTILRPIEFAGDTSPDIDTFKHFLREISNISDIPDIIIHLRPTYPNRSLQLLDECIEKFLNNMNEYDSLRTVIPINKCPYKMYHIENDILKPFINVYKDYLEPFNQARQIFPQTYLHNGCIDIVRTNMIQNNNMLSGRILPFIMNESEDNDIDDIKDFKKSEIESSVISVSKNIYKDLLFDHL